MAMRAGRTAIVGSGLWTVKAVGVLYLLCALSGCFWHRYPRLVVTHAQLLADMAEKGRDLVALGRFTAESLPELTYPYERAAAYETSVRAAAESRALPSLEIFSAMVAQYRTFLQAIDDVRGRRPDDVATARLALDRIVESLRTQVDALRQALATESR